MLKSASKCFGKALRRKSLGRATSSPDISASSPVISVSSLVNLATPAVTSPGDAANGAAQLEIMLEMVLTGQVRLTPLHEAVYKGSKDEVKALLEGGDGAAVDVNAKTTTLYTALHVAAQYGPKEVAELLVRHGADVNARTYERRTPLYIAVEKRQHQVAKLLVTNGADVNAPCEQSLTPLHLAAKACDDYAVELLVEAGASVNAEAELLVRPLHLALGNYDILIDFACAYINGEPRALGERLTRKIRIAKLLLQHGADARAVTDDLETPLHLAVTLYHYPELVPILIAHGAAINCVNGMGLTPLCLAVKGGNPDMIDVILKNRPDVKCANNQKALRIALRTDAKDESTIKKLVEYGIPIRPEYATNCAIVTSIIRNGYENTASEIFKYATETPLDFDLSPLHAAAIYGQTAVGRELLKNGANVDAQDFAGRTPIFFATVNADYDMFKLCLTYEATVKNPSELFHIAAKSGCPAILEVLLKDARCDVNHQDDKGRTALHNANLSIEGVRSTSYVPHTLQALHVPPDNTGAHVETVRFLLKNGADVNARDLCEETPLHIAAREGLDGLVEALLEFGADLEAVDCTGLTALDKSVQFGRCYNVSERLLRAGAKANTQPHGRVTPLHVATKAGDTNHVALLLQHGSEADAVCPDGTPLHIASNTENLAIMTLLLEHDADVNAQGEQGTPLHIAASNGHKDGVETLLLYGADLNLTDKRRLTALECIEKLVCKSCKSGQALLEVMNTFKVILEQVVRMNCAGAYVARANLIYLTSDSMFMSRFVCLFQWSDKFAKLASACEAEVLAMREDKIADSNFTYCDIANSSDRQVMRLLSNPVIIETLSKELYCHYQNYSKIIMSKFEAALKRKMFEDGARKDFFKVYFDELPDVCIDRIMDFFTDRELKMLMDACGH